MATTNIDYRFKILYAIGIIFVVSGHCGLPVQILTDWFPYYSFHLALFVFASGYFYKPENENHIFRYILKKIKTLLIPLYLYNLFYAMFVYCTHQFGFSLGQTISFQTLIIEPWFGGGHQFVYNLGGWFVAPLFTLEIINIFFRFICNKLNIKKWKYHEFAYCILFFCIGLFGIHLAITNYDKNYLLLYRCAYFIPFFGVGQLYKQFLEKYDNKISSILYFSIIFLIQIIVSYYLGYIPSYTPAWIHDFNNGILLPFIVGFTGVAFWFRISKILSPILSNNKYINIIADNAYSIMINQFLGFFLVKLFFAIMRIPNFDYGQFKSFIWWYFYPGNGKHIGLIYLVAGIIVPIYIQKLITRIRYGYISYKNNHTLTIRPAEYLPNKNIT